MTTKDEIKNRISMALKSPVLQQGFEIICRENDELEQQIEELKKENKKLKECITVGTTWNKALNSMNKTLEEERDKYRNMVFDKGEQLTKAKELLAFWVDNFNDSFNRTIKYEERYEALVKAEQFLKE